MFKPIIAGVTALSLTFSSAAPAQAAGLSDDDLGKIIFGIAALAAISTLVEPQANQSRAQVTREISPRPNREHSNDRRHQQEERTVLPRNCLRSYETRFGTHRMFGRRCLQNNYSLASRLPNSCSVRIFTEAGPRRGFDPTCLRSHGYTARR